MKMLYYLLSSEVDGVRDFGINNKSTVKCMCFNYTYWDVNLDKTSDI